jgi:hypothetical protein
MSLGLYNTIITTILIVLYIFRVLKHDVFVFLTKIKIILFYLKRISKKKSYRINDRVLIGSDSD